MPKYSYRRVLIHLEELSLQRPYASRRNCRFYCLCECVLLQMYTSSIIHRPNDWRRRNLICEKTFVLILLLLIVNAYNSLTSVFLLYLQSSHLLGDSSVWYKINLKVHKFCNLCPSQSHSGEEHKWRLKCNGGVRILSQQGCVIKNVLNSAWLFMFFTPVH